MLKHIKLENFRNHAKFELDLSEVTALVGKNGAGKSNVLEAISLLSFCRSFREDDKKSLVNFEADYARVIGDDLEIFLQKSPTFLLKAKERGVFKKQTDFIGSLKSVVFSPETIDIITGSPRLRRRFLDIMISQVDPTYLHALVAFEKVRLERNSLLQRVSENRAQAPELDFWDAELVKEGTVVREKRLKVIKYLNKEIKSLYCQISGKKEVFEIHYLDSAGEEWSDKIGAFRTREIAARCTLYGPHRDDIEFQIDGHSAANFASRGELRTLVLALKIAELHYLSDHDKEKRKNDKPILLLDDVFSEFDAERREHLSSLIQSYQTVITTTDRDHLSADLLKKAKVIELL